MSSNLTCLHRTKKRDFSMPRFILMTDDVRMGSLDTIIAALGAMPIGSGIIVRSRDLSHLKSTVSALRPFCTKHGIALLAATQPQLAAAMAVDGVHLSERDVRLNRTVTFRTIENRMDTWIVTAAAHSIPAVRRARDLGVDGILISPVFPTRSHPDQRTLGSIGYRRLARHAPELACPLGGITTRNLQKLKGAAIKAVVGIDLFINT